MKVTQESDRLIISYLLGELSAEEQAEIERRYFSEDDFFKQVLAVEDDLIDAYLRDGLSARERERFESYFLASADRRDKLETAEALLKHLREHGRTTAATTPARRSWRQSLSHLLRPESLAARIAFASIILVLIGGLWLLVESRRRRAPLQQAQIENHTEQQRAPEPETTATVAQNNQTPQPTPQPTETTTPVSESSKQEETVTKPRSASTSVIASFMLTPGLTRDGVETNKLVIPHSAQLVRLQLSLESSGNYSSYRASLQRVGQDSIWQQTIKSSRMKRSGNPAALKSITLRLPASLLTNGEYLLTLTGASVQGEMEIVGDYPFTVTGRK